MDFNSMMMQAKKMQANLNNTMKKLEETEYEGSSNGIVVKMNGKGEVLSINIPDEVMDDREMLQDMLLIAFNNANSSKEEDREKQLGKVTGGINIPGM